MLGEYLQRSGCKVLHEADDADPPIVQSKLQSIWSPYWLEMIPNLLSIYMYVTRGCYHTNIINYIFLYTQAQDSSNKIRVWDIKSMDCNLGQDICDSILFIHSLGGCDTTVIAVWHRQRCKPHEIHLKVFFYPNVWICSVFIMKDIIFSVKTILVFWIFWQCCFLSCNTEVENNSDIRFIYQRCYCFSCSIIICSHNRNIKCILDLRISGQLTIKWRIIRIVGTYGY